MNRINTYPYLNLKFFFFIAIFSFANFINAQDDEVTETNLSNYDLGIRFGLNFHSMNGSDANSDIGFLFGATVSSEINNRLSWQTELLYLEQGGSQNVDWLGFNFSTNFNINYIAIPVMVKFKPISFLSINGGVQPQMVVTKNIVTSDLFAGQQVDGLDNIQRFDFSWVLGVDIKMPERFKGWGLSAHYRRGLANIASSDSAGDLSLKNRGFSISGTYIIPISEFL